MATKKCIFCGARADSREHLFSEWIREFMANTWIPNRTGDRTHVLAGAVPWKSSDPINVRVRCVCVPCNNKWMGDIDAEASKILTPMMSGDMVQLSLDEQKKVATWAVLKTLVAHYVEAKPRPSHLDWLEWLYKRHEPHANWIVWLGAYAGRLDLWLDTHHITAYSDRGARLPVLGIVGTFVIGHLAIKVMGTRGAGVLRTDPELILPIFPNHGDVCNRPPAIVIKDDTIGDFCSMWLGYRSKVDEFIR